MYEYDLYRWVFVRGLSGVKKEKNEKKLLIHRHNDKHVNNVCLNRQPLTGHCTRTEALSGVLSTQEAYLTLVTPMPRDKSTKRTLQPRNTTIIQLSMTAGKPVPAIRSGTRSPFSWQVIVKSIHGIRRVSRSLLSSSFSSRRGERRTFSRGWPVVSQFAPVWRTLSTNPDGPSSIFQHESRFYENFTLNLTSSNKYRSPDRPMF